MAWHIGLVAAFFRVSKPERYCHIMYLRRKGEFADRKRRATSIWANAQRMRSTYEPKWQEAADLEMAARVKEHEGSPDIAAGLRQRAAAIHKEVAETRTAFEEANGLALAARVELQTLHHLLNHSVVLSMNQIATLSLISAKRAGAEYRKLGDILADRDWIQLLTHTAA
jgi:hypothetical protein